MRLFLCEKPSQGKDIARVIGANIRKQGYMNGTNVCVSWCFGHLLEMAPPEFYDPGYKSWSLETLPIVPDKWQLVVKNDAKKQFNVIGRLLKQCHEVIIATDADREGETIARSVLSLHGYHGSISRLWLSALDDTSIKKALKSILPGTNTEPLYQSGMARQRADWLMGMNLTRAYTCIAKKFGGSDVLSVGRVQSPTLAMIVQRDRTIADFKTKDHFTLQAVIDVDDNQKSAQFKAMWQPDKSVRDTEGHTVDKSIVLAIKKKCDGKTGYISDAITERKTEPAPLPYSLSSLQQEASNILGFSAAKTLKVAQTLYETHKITTYPRTDCNYLPISQHGDSPDILNAMAKSDPLMGDLIRKAEPSIISRAFNDKKMTTHHAIIPTRTSTSIEKLKSDEKLLYNLIGRRYLAQFFPAFEYDKTRITCDIQGEVFISTGRITRIDGWKVVLETTNGKKVTDDANQKLPPVKIHDAAQCQKSNILEKQTKPPQHFTDATLIAAMSNIGREITDPALKKVLRKTSGLGTEATRAGIIDTLIKRSFVKRSGKKMISTAMGQNLIDHLPKQIIDPIITAQWEQALDEIAQGHGSETVFTEHQSKFITDLVAYIQSRASEMSALSSSASQTIHKCPQCSKTMNRRFSTKNKNYFWGCSSYPECQSTLEDKDGQPVKTDIKKPNQPSNRQSVNGVVNVKNLQKCPDCQNGYLVKRKGTKGNFIGCNQFPSCRYTQSC